MKPLNNRQMLVLTLWVTAGSTLLTLVTTQGDVQVALFMIPLVGSAAFWSLRLSQKIARRWAPREPERTAASGPVEQTSERPDHARRRREREQQRPRGRGRRGS